jgi:hypothetical protein
MIVKTSFVSRFDQPSSQSSRLAPLQELEKDPSDVRDTESSAIRRPGPCHSGAITTQSSASAENDRSQNSRTTSRNITKASNTGNTTPRYTQPVPPASPGAERAAVQRVTPPISRRDSGASRTRRSESISSFRDKRPITTGSSASPVSSKLKGLVGWQTSDSDSRHPFMRSSSETNRGASRADDTIEDPSSLDDLINSDETIHFTLTPRNMREMEVCVNYGNILT